MQYNFNNNLYKKKDVLIFYNQYKDRDKVIIEPES